ncbi:MAG TPA: serine/threonine-protein kinase [Gemmatimonadales bacterium]|nr:serine/threonine-protein kinase [Gemmatimonadales bacterium]
MTTRRCPRCHTTYPPPARYCVKDGSPLVEAEATATFAPGPSRSATAPASAVHTEEFVVAPDEVDRIATLSGKLLDRRYQVGRRLGEGGMSYVYRAKDVDSGASVAVKILLPRLSRDPAAVERLRREATIAMRLDHPNVCPILRLGEADRMIYLVMPYLEGEPLSEHETRRGPFAVADAVPLLAQICRGLQHAHELQIIHRDLKPENIMLVPDGVGDAGEPRYRAVVMDFGLAKERRAGPEVAKLTATGIVLGTPEFMSPEQIRGKPLDGRSDVYALGILAFELFTGQLPFAGKSAQETMIARLRGSPAKLRDIRPELPAKLEVTIQRCLAIDPAERFQSMEELAHGFEAVTATGMLGRLFRR